MDFKPYNRELSLSDIDIENIDDADLSLTNQDRKENLQFDKGLLPVKSYYLVPCFRYEKPQAGRLREFHQFGVEYFGSPSPSSDAEIIALPYIYIKYFCNKKLP